MMKSPHECKPKNSRTLQLWYSYPNKTWVLLDMIYRLYEPVQFCPWCGVKLE